jgi:hypothetical protein
MKICRILITFDNAENKMDIQTGGATNLEILEAARILSKHFAQEIIKEYKELTGDLQADPKNLDEYIEFLRKNQL